LEYLYRITRKVQRIGCVFYAVCLHRMRSYAPGIMSLPEPELEAYLASLGEEELDLFLASLPEEELARITALLPPENDDEFLTE